MIGRGVVLSQLRPYLKLVFGNVNLNSCCVPIFQSLASTVAKIGGGPNFFGCSLGPDPRQFWSNTLFSGKLVPNPICVPNLKLLASTVPVKFGADIFIQSGVIDIFPKFVRFWWNSAHYSKCWTRLQPRDKKFKFLKFKMAAAAILKIAFLAISHRPIVRFRRNLCEKA